VNANKCRSSGSQHKSTISRKWPVRTLCISSWNGYPPNWQTPFC